MYGKVLHFSLESLARVSSNLTECNSVIVQQPENEVVHSLILLFPNIDFQVVPINYLVLICNISIKCGMSHRYITFFP